jgi:surfactin synthase thioesterase subunit
VTEDASRWLIPAESDPSAQVQLFLFHHSGGGAAFYREWLTQIPCDIAVQCLQLPGRQERQGEPSRTRLEPLAATISEVLAGEFDGRPYALFGHSMGALVAYRTAVALCRDGWRAPALVGLSAWPLEADMLLGGRDPAETSDEEIVTFMRELGSLPTGIVVDSELLAEAIRVTRSDLQICADYRDDGIALPCPIVTYGGSDDPLVKPGAMRAWADRTPVFLGYKEYSGGHFYITEHRFAVVADLVSLLRRHVESS